MCIKQGMAWADPFDQLPLSIEETIEKAFLHFKATRGRWPNFVRVSLPDAERLGNRLDGLVVIGDAGVGKSYRLMMGWSEEAFELEIA